MSQERDPNLVISGLSKTVVIDGVRLQVNICRLEHDTGWSMEVVTSDGASTVWTDLFPSDDKAIAEFEKTVAEDGIRTFLDPNNVVPFRRA